MHCTLKTFLLWLLIFALPVQGFAAATKCASTHHEIRSMVGPVDHHHHGDVANSDHHHPPHETVRNILPDEPATDHATATATSPASKYAGSSCSSCATCCLGAAALPSDLKLPSFHNGSEMVVDSSSPLVTGYIPAGLERPPKHIST